MTFDLEYYRKIIDRVDRTNHSDYREKGGMDIHQTVNFLIYNIQVALGEIMIKNRSGLWSRWLLKPIDLYWRYSGVCNASLKEQFSNKDFISSYFESDKTTLLDKLRKFIIQADSGGQYQHPIYGRLTKEEYVLLILKMIDFYLKPFSAVTFSHA